MDNAFDLSICKEGAIGRHEKMPGHSPSELRPSSIPPISRLPMEVLICIFESFVLYEDESPWLLVLVSRQWKEVTLGAHHLWSKISAKNSLRRCRRYYISKEIGEVWTQGMAQICRNPEELEMALVRSGESLLDITMYLDDDPSNPMLVPLWNRLLRQPISDRLQKLRIRLIPRLGVTSKPHSVLLESIYPALTLVELYVAPRWCQFLAPQLLGAASRVRSIRTHLSHAQDTSMVNWSNLSHLDLIYNTPPEVFNSFCSQLQNLQQFEGVPYNWPTSSTPLTAFNHLSTLALNSHLPSFLDDLRCLSLPSVKELELRIAVVESLPSTSPLYEGSPPPVWRLPSLVKLVLDIRDLPEYPHWLASVDMPCLQRLTLNVSDSDENGHFVPGVIYPNLWFISITAPRLDHYFIQALEAAPNLSQAYLYTYCTAGSVSRKPGELLLTRLSEQGTNMLCPKLTEVAINGGDGNLIGERDVLEPLLKHVVASRAELLKTFTVSWMDEIDSTGILVEYAEKASDLLE